MKTQLQAACGFAARRSPLNVMNCVRIAKDHCYATDGASSMRIGIDGPDLDVCVDAGTLADILRGFPDDQTIKITQGEGHVLIKGGNRRLKLRTLPSADMPIIESGGEFHEIDPAAVSSALKFCEQAAAVRNVAQPMWTNVVINLTPDGTFAVGCDGMRLHAYKIDDKKSASSVVCAIPRALAAKVAGMCEIGGVLKINRHRAIYTKGDNTFVSVLSGMEYARWQAIVPKPEQYETRAIINATALLSLADNVDRLGAKFVEVNAGAEGLAISADLNGDEFSDQLACDVSGVQSFKMQPGFIVDALKALGAASPVKVHIPKPTDARLPVLFTNDTEHVCFAMTWRN